MHSKLLYFMVIYIFIFKIILFQCVNCNTQTNTSIQAEKNGKFLWPFFVLAPETCKTLMNTEGSCETSKNCEANGGKSSGTCANGYGVCCIFERSCGETTKENNTIFTSQNLSSSSSCTLNLDLENNICQVKLEFLEFELDQPNDEGQCDDSFFAISGGSTNAIPKICGNNNGQHMYINVNEETSSIKLKVYQSKMNKNKWTIKILLIPCGATYAAPQHCLQYFKDDFGIVKSFNYQGVEGSQAPTKGTQLSDLRYTVCLEPSLEYCSISWSLDKSEGNYGFTISGEASLLDPDDIGNLNEALFGSSDCAKDFLLISEGHFINNIGDDTSEDRFCGLGFPDSVTTRVRPFTLHIQFDSNEGEDTLNQGFSLKYKANLCN